MRCGKQASQQRNCERDQWRGHGVSPHGPSHAVVMLAEPAHHLRPCLGGTGQCPDGDESDPGPVGIGHRRSQKRSRPCSLSMLSLSGSFTWVSPKG